MNVDARQLGEAALREGKNIAQTLRAELAVDLNTPEIIEVAYDLQAGTYVKFAEENIDYVRSYASQLADHLRPHVRANDTLLDVGAGELTNLSFMIRALGINLRRIYACDISDARLKVGRKFAEDHMGEYADKLNAFKADIASIPLDDASVDVLTSNHALEPNGGRELQILSELLRVARRKLVLFEPCFEIATVEAKARMESHAYVKDLADAARQLGAEIVSVSPLAIVDNPLNPTACFVINVPER